MSRSSFYRVVTGAVAVSALLAVTTVASPPLGAAHLPTLKVTPSTNLVNNKKVQLTGTGFSPKQHVYAVECLNTATSLAGCSHRLNFTITASGTIQKKLFFTVHTGKIGTGKSGGTCGTATTKKKCSIAIGTGTRSLAGAPITFKG